MLNTMKQKVEAECCPPFDPVPWDDKVFEWKDKRFVADKVCTIFFMPLNFGPVMRRADAKVRAAGARFLDNMGLSDHISKWRMDIYMAVDKEVPGMENITLSGKYYSRVYEGPYKDTGKWCADYEQSAQKKGLSVKKTYMWYTTCPKCARKYGKNYTVILAETD